MKCILLIVLLISSVSCYSQTQDIYIHNGDDRWNQIRRQKERNLEYAEKTAELREESVRKVKECSADVYRRYAQILTYKSISDGKYNAYLVGELLCLNCIVEVKNNTIISFGVVGGKTTKCSSELVNQKFHNCTDAVGCFDIIIM